MSEYQEILAQVFCDVFEQMAFMFGDLVAPDEIESSSDIFIVAKMNFHGDMNGEVEIVIERDMCAIVASNIMGIDIEDEKAHKLGTDAVKEMLNIICGQALTEISGSEPVFNLSVPEVAEIRQKQWKKMLHSEEYLCFDLDDYPALCKLTIAK